MTNMASPIGAMSRTTACALVAALLVAMPARAATQLEPGEWQDTESGTENGEPVPPHIVTHCMTQDDALDPVKALTTLKGVAEQYCKTMRFKEKGSTLSVEVECGDPKIISVAITMHLTFLSSRHYTGVATSTVIFAGKKMASDKKFESEWIGVCKGN
jgi:hypothetical protein